MHWEAEAPDQNLFLNSRFRPWTSDSVVCAIRRMKEATGIDMFVYAYRHTFATDAMLAGNDIATVSALLGHKSTCMVSSVYGHIDKHLSHLSEAASKTARRMVLKERQD